MKDDAIIRDDWLEKERIRENSVSVWDFDDSAKFLADEHIRHHKKAMPRHIDRPSGKGKAILTGIIVFIFYLIFFFILVLMNLL